MAAFIVEHQSPLTAWGQVQRDLRHRIDNGEFVAGSKIPPELELMAYYGVSRITIRRAIGALEVDGYLSAKQGSGTYVNSRTDSLRCEIDISQSWRDQLIAEGHDADSTLVEMLQNAELPTDLIRAVGGPIMESLTFGRHIETLDGTPIALTESWVTEATRMRAADSVPGGENAPVRSTISIETGYANAEQASALRSYLDSPLIVTTSNSKLVPSGRQVEIARTFWLGSRVRFKSVANLTVAHIDMSRLLEIRSRER